MRKRQGLKTRDEDDEEKLLEVLARYPHGETQSTLLDEAGLRNKEGRKAIERLCELGRIVPCQVTKGGGPGNRPYPGYRLVDVEMDFSDADDADDEEDDMDDDDDYLEDGEGDMDE